MAMRLRRKSDNGRSPAQGPHPDPRDPGCPPPNQTAWTPRQRDAFCSDEMRLFRAGLCVPGSMDPRASVLDDLSTYFGLPAEECLHRCIEWEQFSVDEWQAARRDSPAAVRNFYRTNVSWAFDTLWYTYLQAEGYAYPVSVVIARALPGMGKGLRHLDFGSGSGVTSQLFHQLGYEVDLADVSTSLLNFARFRLDRRGYTARYIDLNDTTLEPGRYDVITAINTLQFVTDFPATVTMLHRALKPGGLLFANFDTRVKTRETAWYMYERAHPLRWRLQRTGFEPEEKLDNYMHRFRRTEPRGLTHIARGARDLVALRSPLRPVYRTGRVVASRALRAVIGKSATPMVLLAPYAGMADVGAML